MSVLKCKVIKYADDTSISHSVKNINDLNDMLNRDLDQLREWLQGSKP